MRATYSPEDNKLRLYPETDEKLPKDIYERLIAAGFRWGGHQQLFVVPMWTPGRESLLLELVDDIEDEDTSLAERAEVRAERFGGYREKRLGEAVAAAERVDELTGGGTLVAHHKPRVARKLAEKVEEQKDRAVKLWKTSRYWLDRAKGALAHAKYKNRPGVRMRRIKTLEADLRKHQRSHQDAKKRLAFWSPATVNHEDALRFLNYNDHGSITLLDGQSWTAWSALHDGLVSVEYVRACRLKSLPPVVEHELRWIEHLANRLAYERAMLEEGEAPAAVATRPTVGGAVRCWASPGFGKGWSYITKVNKVSVTIRTEHPDSRGGMRSSTQPMPLDKIAAIMTVAQVQEAIDTGRATETATGAGFYLADEPATPDEKLHAEGVQRTALGDADPDSPAIGRVGPGKMEDMPAIAERMRKLEDAPPVQVVVAPTLFPTPPPVVFRLIELAQIKQGCSVLEPSAGTGALAHALRSEGAMVACVEIDHKLCQLLAADFTTQHGDFLDIPVPPIGRLYDRVVMNPPFNDGADIKHIQHAFRFVKPGGRLAAVCANGPRQRDAFFHWCTFWIDLPAGSFMPQTNVNAAIVVLDKIDL